METMAKMRFEQYLIEAPHGEAVVERLFNKLVKSDNDRERLMGIAQIISFYNKKFFKGKLKPAGNVRFSKETKAFVQRGSYWPGRNEFTFRRKIFNAYFMKFREIVLHEMCHQASVIISRLPREQHGTNWRQWMINCGLNPNRLDYEEKETYMTTAEKKVAEVEKTSVEKAIKKERLVWHSPSVLMRENV